MKFWDSSAVVALLVDEPGQSIMQHELELDSAMAVWWGTRVECVSALARRERDQLTDAASTRSAYDQLGKLAAEWHEVLPAQPLRDAAERMLRVHVLRAADALQLAAALAAAAGDPGTLEFLTLDQRLKDAASREGLRVR